MARNSKLRDAAVKIGGAAGRLDGTARKAAQRTTKALSVAQSELADLSKQLDALKDQLAKSSKRLQNALK